MFSFELGTSLANISYIGVVPNFMSTTKKLRVVAGRRVSEKGSIHVLCNATHITKSASISSMIFNTYT